MFKLKDIKPILAPQYDKLKAKIMYQKKQKLCSKYSWQLSWIWW